MAGDVFISVREKQQQDEGFNKKAGVGGFKEKAPHLRQGS